jgi:RNA polymerase-binding transcription factor DksA
VEIRADRGDDGDRAAQAEPMVSQPSVLDRIQHDLDGVEQALQRLDDGSYGTCRACGAAIPDERLATEPIARYCAEHRAAPAG